MIDKIVLPVIDALDALGVQYMLVGSLASNAWGRARLTQDADIVIELGGVSIDQIMEPLRSDFRLDPQMQFETVTATSRFILYHKRIEFSIELFLLRSDDPCAQERFRRRVKVEAFDRLLWLPTAEDVIITKLRWSKQGRRSKDIDDARNVLAVQKGRLDLAYIEHWCRQHGTWDMFLELQRSLEGIA